ncbi:MAG: hypothetical protein KAR25_02330 [Methanosarcinales archaeon]|nr:hypothetical protein [Methanosarcinales archaeon]
MNSKTRPSTRTMVLKNGLVLHVVAVVMVALPKYSGVCLTVVSQWQEMQRIHRLCECALWLPGLCQRLVDT